MDTTKVFEYPVKEHWRQPRCLLGAGAWEAGGPEAAEMGLKHVLFVTSGLSGTGIVDEVEKQLHGRGRGRDRLRQGGVQPQGLQRDGRAPALRRGGVRRLRVGRRRQLARRGQGRADRGRPRRAQHQRVRGHQHVREARQPAPDRDQHHQRDRLGDHAGLRDHRHHLGQRSVQVGRLRPRGHHHAGHQRPDADDDPAGRVRGLHGLRHAGPRLGVLRQPGAVRRRPAAGLAGRAAGRGEPARGLRQPAELQGHEQHDVGAVHGRPGVLVGAARHHPLALPRRVRLLRRPPRAQQRRRHRARVDLQRARLPGSLRRHRSRDARAQAGDEPGRGRRRRGRGGHPPGPRLRDPRELAERPGVPEVADRQGLVRELPHRHRAEGRRSGQDGRPHVRRPVHAGQPAQRHPGDLPGDPARLRLRQHGQQGRAHRSTAARRTAAPAPRCPAWASRSCRRERSWERSSRASARPRRQPAPGVRAGLGAGVFEGIEDVRERLAGERYVCDRRLATVVFLATEIGKPVLVEGPAGVGKTELAKVLADALERRADPPAVLRGARRVQGALRVGVRQAAALHAGAAARRSASCSVPPRTCTRPPQRCAARRTCSSRRASWSSGRSCVRCAPSAARCC